MTYNFDPDRWLENELAFLRAGRESGALTPDEYRRAVEELQERYEQMLERLDGSYQLPPSRPEQGAGS